jgi:hypothetical protein
VRLGEGRWHLAIGGPVEVVFEDETVFGIAALRFVKELPVPLAAIQQRGRAISINLKTPE